MRAITQEAALGSTGTNFLNAKSRACSLRLSTRAEVADTLCNSSELLPTRPLLTASPHLELLLFICHRMVSKLNLKHLRTTRQLGDCTARWNDVGLVDPSSLGSRMSFWSR